MEINFNKPITLALFNFKSAFFCYNKKMENVFITKMKNVLFFILKSAILIFICIKILYIFVYIAMFVNIIYACVFKIFVEQPNVWYLAGVTTQVLQIAVFYFISKKLGIIKTFDKLPFWVLLLIAFVYEIIFTYYAIGSGNVLDNPKYCIGRMIYFSLHGTGYLYTFLFYSLKRFKVIEFILRLRRRR